MRVLSPSGVLTTIAGTLGLFGQLNGVGAAASFSAPFALAVHPISGLLYLSDGNAVRQLTPSGAGYAGPAAVDSFAGGAAGFADGERLAVARFSTPRGLAFSPGGMQLFIADSGNNRIRTLDLQSNVVATLAGSGAAGMVDGTGGSAALWAPSHLAWDTAIFPGGLLVADELTNRVRSVSLAGVVRTVVGSGEFSGVNGAARAAGFRAPRGIATTASGAIFVADSQSATVRMVVCPSLSSTPTPSPTPSLGASPSSTPTPSSPPTATPTRSSTPTGTPTATPTPSAPCTVATFAGTVGAGFADGAAAAAKFWTPVGLAVGPSGTVFVADSGNVRIRAITPAGVVSTLAGSGSMGITDGAGAGAQFGTALGGLAVSPNGTLFVADLGNHRIRRIETPTATVSTAAGSAPSVVAGYADGTAALFSSPDGLALDPAAWLLYVTEGMGNNRVRVVRVSDGRVSTLAGSQAGTAGWADTYFGSGAGGVLFSSPQGAAWVGGVGAPSGPLLVIADKLNSRMRLVSAADGAAGTLAGITGAAWGDGVGAASGVPAPAYAVTISSASVLGSPPLYSAGPFVLFSDSNRLRAVDVPTARVVTLAGTGTAGSANGAPLTSTLNNPLGVAADASLGRAYVADSANHLIRVYSCAAYASYSSSATPSFSPSPSPSPTGAGATFSATPTAPPSMTASPTATGTAAATPSNSPTPSPSAAGCFVSLLAGTGAVGNASGPALAAAFNAPVDVAAWYDGVFVTSQAGNNVQVINLTTGAVRTLAGLYLVSGTANGPTGEYSQFNSPSGLSLDAYSNGTLLVSVTNYKLRATNPFSGATADFACSGSPIATQDGPVFSAGCYSPMDLAADAAGNIFFVDSNVQTLRVVTPSPASQIRTLSGIPKSGGFADGEGTASMFSGPQGVAVHPTAGLVFVVDTGNHRIRRVQWPSGFTTTLAGSATLGLVDGAGGAAQFSSPRKAVLDPTGLALVVADCGNNAVRWVVISSGLVSTLAGGTAGNVVGPALLARFNGPSGVAFSPSGTSIYISDQANNQVKVYACSAPSRSPTPTPTLSQGASPSITPTTSRTSTQTPTSSLTPTATPLSCVFYPSAGTYGWTGFVAGNCATPGSCVFSSPGALAADPSGAFAYYILDASRLMRVSNSGTGPGVLSSFAGSTTAGYANGASGAAQFNTGGHGGLVISPAWPTAGSFVYVVDTWNQCIRSVTPAGTVALLSGSGAIGYADGNPLTARFTFTAASTQLALSPALWPGVLLVAETGGNRIRRISTANGWTGTLAGSGAAGSADGPCAAATFSGPRGIAIDPRGTVFISDTGNNKIRAIPAGTCIVYTFAGTGTAGAINAVGPSSSFSIPINLVFDANNTGSLLVAESGNGGQIRSVHPVSGAVDTFAGVGSCTGSCIALGNARQQMGLGGSSLKSIGVSPSGVVYASMSSITRQIICPPGVYLTPTPTPTATTLLTPSAAVTPSPTASPSPGGGGASGGLLCTIRNLAGAQGVQYVNASFVTAPSPGYADGTGFDARFSAPRGLALDAPGKALYVCDTGSHIIRRIDTQTGATISVAGLAGSSGAANGVGSAALFNAPYAAALWSPAAVLFVTDSGGHRIRAISLTTAAVTFFSGTGATGYSDSAVGTSAVIQAPRGLALLSTPNGGTLYVADGLHRIRAALLTGTNAVTTVAGSGLAAFADGVGALASFNSPRGLALSLGADASAPTLYVSDSLNFAIRAVTLSGINGTGPATVTTLSGTPPFSGMGEGAAPSYAYPTALALDPFNNTLLVTDSFLHTLRAVVLSSGAAATFAGVTGMGSGSMNNMSGTLWATAAPLFSPEGVAAAPAADGGAIYLSDTMNNAIRAINCAASQSPSATPSSSATGGVTPTTTASVSVTPTPSPTPSATLTPSTSRTPSGTPSPNACTAVRFAGTGTAGLASASGGATGQFSSPAGLGVDWAGQGTVYIVDKGNFRLRACTVSGNCPADWVGRGVALWANGQGAFGGFAGPSGAALASAGPGVNATLWVADAAANRIRIVWPDGRMGTVAGGGGGRGSGWRGYPGAAQCARGSCSSGPHCHLPHSPSGG